MTTKVSASVERSFRTAVSRTVPVRASSVASNQAAGKRHMPLFIPADQAYYWSSAWQRGEAESLANLKSGNARTFDEPLDAIHHLLSDD